MGEIPNLVLLLPVVRAGVTIKTHIPDDVKRNQENIYKPVKSSRPQVGFSRHLITAARILDRDYLNKCIIKQDTKYCDRCRGKMRTMKKNNELVKKIENDIM